MVRDQIVGFAEVAGLTDEGLGWLTFDVNEECSVKTEVTLVVA